MTSTRPRIVAAITVAAVLLIAACSDDDEPTATTDTTEASGADDATTADDGAANPYGETPDTTAEETEPAASGSSIAVADSDLGEILVDGQGVTLYVFTNDTQGEPSTCTGGCSSTWPALTGTVTAGDGVDEALIGTVTGEDGTEQATYDGWPLYYYASDTGPGDTTGQGVGDVWWVIDAAGTPVES